MKKLFSVAVLLCALLVAGGQAANAQKEQRLNRTPAAFQKFYTKFRNAVVKKNKTVVASLVDFPFNYGFDAGDEGSFTKAEFLKNFNRIFGDKPGIFAQKNPVLFESDGNYVLRDDSDASAYMFDKIGSSYRFSAIMVEP